jgi:hypothetical protein
MPPPKITLQDLRGQFMQPVIDIKDVRGLDGNPLYKSLPFWRRNKLLPFIPKSSWGYEISMAQLVWLRILDHLRSLGYPVLQTEKIADYFFKDAYFDDLPAKNLKEQKKELQIKEVNGTLSESEAYILTELDRILNDEVLLYGLKFDVSYLSNLVFWCVNAQQEAGVLIFAEGKVAERRGDSISNHRGENFDFEAPHIYISIKALLKEFVENKELSVFVESFNLTPEEKFVLQELRTKNIKELRIVVQSEKIVRIDSRSDQALTGAAADEIKKILRMKNYEEVSISTRDNKTLSFSRTKKTMTSGKSGSKK